MKNANSLNNAEPSADSLDIALNTISRELSNSKKAGKNDILKEPAWKCRHVVTLIGFLLHLSASIHRTIMTVTIVAMVNNTAVIRNSKLKSESCVDLIANSTEASRDRKSYEGEFIWSPETQGYVLGCFFFGHLFTLIPAGRLAERFGCKWILVGALSALSILTLLIPPSARWSASALIVIQILRGFAQGVHGPCITILMVNWCPKVERAFLYSLVQTSHSLGPALEYIFAGYISESQAGWPYAFYTIGGLGLVLAVCIFFSIAENPREHPRISKAELNYILSQQESKLSRRRPKLPWRQMLTSVPLYILIFAVFGRQWSASQFRLAHSTFLGTILHYPIGQNGLFSALPYLFSFVTSLIASWISGYMEKNTVASISFIRKFWIFITYFLYSLCLLGIYLAGCNRDVSVIFSILSMGAFGLGTPGTSVVVQDMSPTFAGTLYSITSTVGLSASVIFPVVVGYLTDEKQTLEQWNKVFFLSIGIVMSSAITFTFFGTVKIQPWNFVENENKKEDEIKPKNDRNDEVTRF